MLPPNSLFHCSQYKNIFIFRYPDGTVRLRNSNIELMDQDILYHLALGSGSHDLVEMFGDVKVLYIVYYFFFISFFIIISITITVCMHGGHTEKNGRIFLSHHERNWS